MRSRSITRPGQDTPSITPAPPLARRAPGSPHQQNASRQATGRMSRHDGWTLGTVMLTVACVLASLPHGAAGLSFTPASPTVPRLAWDACAPPTPAGFQCTQVRVPLDYRHPRGRMISLALIRHPAGDPTHRMGSVFFNPGGPATSGVATLPSIVSQLPDLLKARFDWVSRDPRGVGASTAVQCFASYPAELRFFGGVDPRLTFPVGRRQMAASLRRYRRFGRLCTQRNGRLLKHVSTADTARDLDLPAR
jgi:hypothetical protein